MPLYFSRIESSCGSFVGLKRWYMKKICCLIGSKCGGGAWPKAGPAEGKPMAPPQCAQGGIPAAMPPGQGHCAPGAGHGIIGGSAPGPPSFSGLRLRPLSFLRWLRDRERRRLCRLLDRELRRRAFLCLLRRPAPDFLFGARAELCELRALRRCLLLLGLLLLLLLPRLPSAPLSRAAVLSGEDFVFRLSVGLTGVSLERAGPASPTAGTGDDEAALFRARPLARA